jgi:hypothetical protein
MPKATKERNCIYLLYVLAYTSIVVFVIHKCGYSYHLYPVLFFTILVLVFLALSHRSLLMPYLALLGSLIYLVIAYNAFHFSTETRERVLTVAEHLKEYRNVAILSSSVSDSFPAIIYAQSEWAMSAAFMFHLPTAYMDQREASVLSYHTPEAMTPLERRYHDMVIRDLERKPDALVMLDYESMQGLPPEFNMLEALMMDQRFISLWESYRLEREIYTTDNRRYKIYALKR